MKTEKKSISLPSALLAKAEQRVLDDHYSGLSDYIQELIRRDLNAHTATGQVNYSVMQDKDHPTKSQTPPSRGKKKDNPAVN